MKIRKKSIKKNEKTFKKRRFIKKKKKLKTFKKKRVINKKKKKLKTLKKRGGSSSIEEKKINDEELPDTVCNHDTNCSDGIGQIIGRGANSNVYECVEKEECLPTGKKIIAITKNTLKEKSLEREKKGFGIQKKIYNLVLESNKFDKSNIPISEISYCGNCTDMVYIRPYKIEEKSGKELFYLIEYNRLSMDLISKLFFPIFKLLKVMHTNGYAHRDIKAENVLIHDNDQSGRSLKLIDFGFAQKKGVEGGSEEGFTKICGTPEYVAPELFHLNCSSLQKKNEISGEEEALKLSHMLGHPIDYYDEKCDLFSIGVLLFKCANGVGFSPFTPIFSENNSLKEKRLNYQAIKEIQTKRDIDKYWGNIKKKRDHDEGRELRNLIKLLLRVDPEERISAEQALEHVFFIEQKQRFEENSSNHIKTKSEDNSDVRKTLSSVLEEVLV